MLLCIRQQRNLQNFCCQHAIPKAKTIEARKVKSSTTGSPRSPSAGSAGEGSASAGSATSPVLSSCNPNPNSNPNFHVKSPNLSGSAGVGATGVAATTSKSIWMNLNSPCEILHFLELVHHMPSLETRLFFLFTTCFWRRVIGSDFLTVGSLWFFHARMLRSGLLLRWASLLF